MKNFVAVSALGVVFAASASMAFAQGTPLANNGDVPATTLNFGYLSTVAVTNNGTPTAFQTSTISGTYTDYVIYDSQNVYNGQCSGPNGDCLTFVLELNSSGASDSNGIEHISSGDDGAGFGSVSTTVGYETMDQGTATGVAPITASEYDGVIEFNFPGANAIAPGSFADYLVIDTNASSYAAGNFSLIDSTTSTNAGFVPMAANSPVPEPNSLLLMGTGLLAAAGLLFARRRNAMDLL
jgi:hypothetical protein